MAKQVGTVRVSIRGNRFVDVPAYAVSEYLAITGQMYGNDANGMPYAHTDLFVITHLPSGMTLGMYPFRKITHAKKAMKRYITEIEPQYLALENPLNSTPEVKSAMARIWRETMEK